jgi:heparosan-N-sulfate-glucuronate 5-epimerase
VTRLARIANKLLSIDFGLPPGAHTDPERPAGYPIDFSVKAVEPAWPPPWLGRWRPLLFVAICQYGLGCYERFLATGDEAWLDAARAAGEHLLSAQERSGPRDGGWVHTEPLGHTYDLRPPWMSAMAQGEGASLLVRLFSTTGEESFGEAAQRALRPMRLPTERHGVSAPLAGRPLPEEYPTTPPSFVLNGALFAIWGFRDVASGLNDSRARAEFDAFAGTLASNLSRWDTGRWSRYDLFPHRVANLASPAYHTLHIHQLAAMEAMCDRPEYAATRVRFERYAASRRSRLEAAVRKAGFRLLTPRRGTSRGILALARGHH